MSSESTPNARSRATTQSALAIVVSVAVGAVVAVAGSVGGVRLGGWPVFALCAALAFGINWLAFVPAYLRRTERFYDLTGTLTYLSVVVLAWLPARGRCCRSCWAC